MFSIHSQEENIGVNFIFFPEMTRNSIFDLENWGSTYTQEVDLYTSKYGSLHLSKFSSSVYKSAKPIMSDILVYVNKRSFLLCNC